ncbi:unnamed protein product [Mytilus coruscus]|uniref:CASP2 n=1 Tax=Mytilus coruscus TaxID=42192 RepID=A0A6J8B609_MYTCO|nr:unnamed protein product [Mytilus coruscus]
MIRQFQEENKKIVRTELKNSTTHVSIILKENNTTIMEEKHRKILQESFAFLIKNLPNVATICDKLYQDGILTSGLNDTIQHKKPAPTAQIRELLSILPRRGRDAYGSFIKALVESENTHASDFLQEKDGSKFKELNPQNSGLSSNKNSEKPKDCSGDIQESIQQYSGKTEANKKLASPNIQDWPDLNKKMAFVKKDDIIKCIEKSFTEIYESRKGKVYDMTGKKKGKMIIISNVQCPHSTEAKSTVDSHSKGTESIKKCGKLVDFDQTAILQLFKELKYESKAADLKKSVSGEIMKTFLADQLCKGDNSAFDSLVIVIFSGGLKYRPGHIYDKNGIEVKREGIIDMIRKSIAFKDKPKIVIIRTYNFEGETETMDVLDAEKHDILLHTKEPNTDDLFMVSSQPRTKKGPWIIGDEINGSYFIQAFIHIFKHMAHDKSFMEMMKEIDNCLTSALVPDKGKQDVANVIILEHSEEKDLFFFPGLTGIVTGWPDLKSGGKTVQKKNIKQCSGDFYDKITKETTTYSMTGVKRGQFILISNTQCKPQSSKTISKEEEDKEKRYSDFDKSSINQLFKYMGYDTDGTQVDKTNEEMKEFLKRKFSEIDNNTSPMYDSLVILFLSGKYESSTTEIYDRDGENVPKKDILEIIKSCKHFKGKPKVVIIQTYSVKGGSFVIIQLKRIQYKYNIFFQ